MIRQYKIYLEERQGPPLRTTSAYALYGMLLRMAPPHVAEALHQNRISPISQYLIPRQGHTPATWVVSLLGEEIIAQLAPLLESQTDFLLNNRQTLTVREMQTMHIPSVERLWADADRLVSAEKPQLTFLTPTTFKMGGTYQLFPTVSLLLKNLVHRWNRYAPAYALEEEDTLEALIHGIKIAGYQLKSNYFLLKSASIPAFQGELRFSTRLAPPLADWLKRLLYFSALSGIGIKTVLGMGGTSLPMHAAESISEPNPVGTKQ